MKNTDEVAVFWDYENCPIPTNVSGYAIVDNIRSVSQAFGSIKLFKAYLEVTEQVPVSRAQALRSELQSSGVSLTDCPHNGRKDVADKMILVDMLAHAIDNPAPSTIVLISGDRDFAYALSILRLRRYRVVLIALSNAHPSLTAQASLCFDWASDVLDPTLGHQPISPRRGKASSPPAHEKFYSDLGDHNPSRYSFQESHVEKSASNSEFMNIFQEAARCRKNCRTPPKHDARHDFLPSDLEKFKIPVTSGALRRNEPESPARIVYPPVMSVKCSLETTLTNATAHISKASAPKLATHRCTMPFKPYAHGTLRGCASLPNLKLAQVASATEPTSVESATQIPPDGPDVQGPLPSSQQQDAPLPINAKTQSSSGVDRIDDNRGNLTSLPGYLSAPPNITAPPSSSPPPFMLPTPLSQAVVDAVTQSPSKAANPPPQPTSFPAVPENFKILIQCLKTHRSKGRLRPLRGLVALEIQNGNTYRKAGVLKFRQYVALAEKAGIIELGGSESTAWIALKAPWYDVPLS